MGLTHLTHHERITVDPDLHMAELLTRAFGHPISRDQVAALIRNHWSKLEVLAHAIHHQQLMQES